MLLAEEYFIIEAKASEWVYTLDKLIADAKDTLQNGDVVVSLELPYPVYYLSRKRFPAKLIARAIGGKESQVESSKVIRLEPYRKDSNLPNPTVPYFGEG